MVERETSPNRDRLVATARRIESLLKDVVFVGGQLTELLVTEPTSAYTRPTDDVDVIVRITTRTAYRALEQRLAALGFHPDTTPNAPVCRFRTNDGLVLDVMPLDSAILGFSNRWYPYAIETAVDMSLGSDLTIRMVSAPAFLATKWEAFRSRGNDNMLMSHDIEDIITLVAGRPSIVQEVRDASSDVRRFVATQARELIHHEDATEIIEDALPDARLVRGVVSAVTKRLEELSVL